MDFKNIDDFLTNKTHLSAKMMSFGFDFILLFILSLVCVNSPAALTIFAYLLCCHLQQFNKE